MAREELTARKDELERLADILVRQETIDAEQFAKILDGVAEVEVFPDVPVAIEGEGEVPETETAEQTAEYAASGAAGESALTPETSPLSGVSDEAADPVKRTQADSGES